MEDGTALAIGTCQLTSVRKFQGIVVNCRRDCWSRPSVVPRMPPDPAHPSWTHVSVREQLRPHSFQVPRNAARPRAGSRLLSACPVSVSDLLAKLSFPSRQGEWFSWFWPRYDYRLFPWPGQHQQPLLFNLGVIPSAASWGHLPPGCKGWPLTSRSVSSKADMTSKVRFLSEVQQNPPDPFSPLPSS